MRLLSVLVLLALTLQLRGDSPLENDFAIDTHAWQAEREERLRGERGWLSLVGRYPLQAGENSFGSGSNNDIVLPESLEVSGPDRLGSIFVDGEQMSCTLRLADGVKMFAGDEQPFSGERAFQLEGPQRDWVWLGRMSMHVMPRDGNYYLRIADSQAKTRTEFPGCTWYPPNEEFCVEAKYVPYTQQRRLTVKSIINDESQEACPGYAEFTLDGRTFRLDAIQEGEGLFFVFRDATAGDTTYAAARFIDIAPKPADHGTFTLDFNRAYNPPCAFSAYTVCPLPPKQNVLDIRIEAGETLTN